jgi:hypothetical protein
MLDDEIKKLLQDLEIDEEKNDSEPVSYSPLKTLFVIIAITVLPAAFMCTQYVPPAQNYIAYNDYEPDLQKEREESAAAWAREVVRMNPEVGEGVHTLWDMLRWRKEDLEEVTKQLSNLLYDNARLKEDFYRKNAEALLSRYRAIDARHSVQVADQIHALYEEVKKEKNAELTRAYASMLGELGAESYSYQKTQDAKGILEEESE